MKKHKQHEQQLISHYLYIQCKSMAHKIYQTTGYYYDPLYSKYWIRSLIQNEAT